ncbi:hypothetical protein ACRRTK_015463 [Alexandromys fortis]
MKPLSSDRPKPMDMIFRQLAFIHIVLLITGTDIWLTDIFESLNIDNDFKFLLWMYDPVTLSVQKFVMNVYPTITPLIQIISDNRIINMMKHMQSVCHQIFKKG